MKINVYVANLAAYNAGKLIGKWMELPMDADDMHEELKNICGTDEDGNIRDEWAIHDYEAPFFIGELENLGKLNDTVETLAALDIDEKVLKLLLEEMDGIEEVLEVLESGDYRIYYGCKDMEDVAYEVIEESGMLAGVPDEVQRYFNYDAYGRDLSLEGTFYIDFMNEIVVEII